MRVPTRSGAAYRCGPGALVNQLIDLGTNPATNARVSLSWDNTDSTGATTSRASRTLTREVTTSGHGRYLSVCL